MCTCGYAALKHGLRGWAPERRVGWLKANPIWVGWTIIVQNKPICYQVIWAQFVSFCWIVMGPGRIQTICCVHNRSSNPSQYPPHPFHTDTTRWVSTNSAATDAHDHTTRTLRQTPCNDSPNIPSWFTDTELRPVITTASTFF